MADTLTANYQWVKPEVGASSATWGSKQNGVFDEIDSVVFSNQQGVSPVGSGALWFTGTPPANWLLCQGQSLATTGTYAALFAAIGYTYGGAGANFNLPNLSNVFPIGSGSNVALAAVGGASSIVLGTTMLPSHTHPITQVAHTHTASQPAHAHGDPGHVHGVNDPTHVHSGSVAIAPGFGIGPSGPSPIVPGGATGVTINPAATGISIALGGTNLKAAQPGVTVNATTPTGPTVTGSVGSGTPVPTVPPFLAINFIIRFQ